MWRSRSLRLIILLLAFGLLVQNTCPHGFAGKTSLASACAHCPLKQIYVPPSQAHPNIEGPSGKLQGSSILKVEKVSYSLAKAHSRILSDASSLHFPFFIFSVPKAIPLIALEPVDCGKPGPANSYEDASPREFLRPPQA